MDMQEKSLLKQKVVRTMKVCGVIAEYDPLHKGHAWHLQQAREKSMADFVICVMSMSFTQRGTPALLCPHDRAEMALRCGADIVLGVPYAFSVCDAEKFALGGVEILRKTGVVDALSFGIEPDGVNTLLPAAELLEAPTNEFTTLLRSYMQQGLSFPNAQGKTLAQILQTDERVFTLPNTSLAICYVRACKKTNAQFEMYPVSRRGDYHADTLMDDPLTLPSATAVRAAFMQDNMAAVQASMPEEAYCILKRAIEQGCVQKYTPLDSLLRWRLRKDDLSLLPDLSEGIENRLVKAADSCTRDEMVLTIKTKRYTYARMSRLLTHVLTQTNAADIPSLPEYAYLLGFKKDAAQLLHEISKNELQLYPRLPAAELSPMQQLDQRADELWALGAQTPFGALYRAQPVIL